MPDYHKLKFELTGVEKIHNQQLADRFHAAHRHMYEQGYHADRAIRVVYHGTKASNIPSIIENNFSLDKKRSNR